MQDVLHDGDTEWTAGRDGAVRSWHLDTTAAVAAARAALRPISPARWQLLALQFPVPPSRC